jgi:RNA polymerase sigma factor (sigma-70 family)
MQVMNAAVAARPAGRAKKQYANDGSFESVKDMMQAMASRFYVTGFKNLGSALTQEDLFQEACMAYMRAKEKFDAERGVKFITYCQWACHNRMLAVLEQAKLYRSRYSSLDGFTISSDEDGPVTDCYAHIADESPLSNPMDAQEMNQEMRRRVDSLSPTTRLVVLRLLSSELNPSPNKPSTLPEIVTAMKLTPAQISAVQKELTAKLGLGRLTWKKPNKCSVPTASESLPL